MKRFSLMLLIFTLLSGGCSDNSASLSSGDVSAPMPLALRVSLEGNVYTRATTVLFSGSIGIFQLPENYTQDVFIYSAISGVWTTGRPLLLSEPNASICLWYPYSYRVPASLADVQAFPLNAQKYAQAADLCYQTTVGGLNNRNYSLQALMQHAYAQIEFRLSRDITFKASGSVGNITLSAPGLRTGATLDITAGTYANPVTGNVVYAAGVTVPATGDVATAVLLPPATLTGNISLTFRVDNKDMVAVLPQASLPQLAAGTKYVIYGILQSELKIVVTTAPLDGSSGGDIVW